MHPAVDNEPMLNLLMPGREGHFIGRCCASILASVFGLAVVVLCEGSQFDISRYRPAELAEVVAEYLSRSGLEITPDVPIRSRVTYAGQFRGIQDDSRRLLAAWSQSMNVAGMLDTFKREVKVRAATVDYWLPIQEALVPGMMRELRPDEVIEIFAIYIGQVDGRHLFLINAFTHDGPHGPSR